MESVEWTAFWAQVLVDVGLKLAGKILDGLRRAKEFLVLVIKLDERILTALEVAEGLQLVD